MARVDTSFNNFARGKIDHDMMGRYDLPVYQTGADVVENFLTDFEGNAIYRPGFEDMEAFQDCYMIEFKFNNAQQYICVFFASTVQFLSYDVNGNFGWVLNGGGTTLQVSTPYSLAESKQLSYSQNSDVMVIVHPTYAPMKLTRVSANSFTLATFVRTADPFTGAGLYPSCVLFYKGRLFYAAPTTKPTTIYGSTSGQYDDFTLTPVTATSAFVFTLADIAQPILWLFPGDNSLIVGASDGICAVNGGAVGVAVTAANFDSTLTSAPPCNSAYPLKKDGLIFYIGIDGRNMYYFSYDVLTTTFIAGDANFISYDITEGGITKIRYKRDRNDIIFGITNNVDKKMVSCNFQSKENIIGWHDQFTNGEFHDHAVITDNNGIPQLFSLVLRNGTYYIERLSNLVEFSPRVNFFTGKSDEEKNADEIAYKRYVAEQLKDCICLDNALTLNNLQNNVITFDGSHTIAATSNVFAIGDIGKHIVYQTQTGYESGRFQITGYTDAKTVTVDVLQTPSANTFQFWYLTFQTVTGLSQYDGTTIGVVTDGGYLNDFLVASGTIDLGKQVTSAVFGYRYKGIIKSFCLGFQIQGLSTQKMMKAISEFNVRCVFTAGLEVGSSLYKTEPVQELKPDDINYLPPVPIDGTKTVSFTDDYARDKYFFAVQDQPLPAIIASVILTANYTT